MQTVFFFQASTLINVHLTCIHLCTMSDIGSARVFTTSDLGNDVSVFLTMEGHHLLHTF